MRSRHEEATEEMLTVEGWTTIRYLHAQGKGIRAICRELGVARKTVRRALRQDAVPKYRRPPRPNRQLAPVQAQIRELYFTKHLIGSRILREVRAAGYRGGQTAFYDYLRTLKTTLPSPRVTERFETPPGHQGQFDWSPYLVDLGGIVRRVIVYGLTLGYSRRTHYTASFDERQASIFEAIEAGLWHFGGAPKELLVDNPRAFVVDAHPDHFRWNPQFLELCGHYRVAPRACQVRRPRTKGKVERPFFYLEQQFIKGTSFTSFEHFLDELARFEREDLDVRVHYTTRERPLDRFQAEVSHLTPLPARRFVGALAEARKVSWDCLVSYRGSRYSVPAAQAGTVLWVLVSHGATLRVVDARREVIAEHALSATPGAMVIDQTHYAGLRQGTPRTYAVLAEAFLTRFPHQAAFLAGLTARAQQRKASAAPTLRAVMEVATLYDDASLEAAFTLAHTYQTYTAGFLRGLLASQATPCVAPAGATATASVGGVAGGAVLPQTAVRCDLGVYQQLLEVSP